MVFNKRLSAIDTETVLSAKNLSRIELEIVIERLAALL